MSPLSATKISIPTRQSIDDFSARLAPEVRHSVYQSSKIKSEKRAEVMQRDFADPDGLRKLAGQIKQHTLDHLEDYLEKAEQKLIANGAHVHWAETGEEANRIILDILQQAGARRLVKAKSMVSEEIELVPFLEKHGIEALETDLGEFIVQIDRDHPSHIVTPIIHKNRQQIARSFERYGLGDYNDDPATITQRARRFLRAKYFQAEAGMTGANFVVAESGRIVTVTNEGNARFCVAAPRLQITLVGIEKVIPRDRDLHLFLNLLARSATAQALTVYTQFLSGPRAKGQPDGAEQLHVVFLDNRRSAVLAGEQRPILRCIRCGACLNVCPVYRQSSGHAYREVYPGPVGIVLAPLLTEDFAELADLPKASSLCGACNEVCPVDIPISELILRLRDRAYREHSGKAMAGTPPMGAWATLASRPSLWRAALAAGHAMNLLPRTFLNLAPPATAWQASRDLPPFRGGAFRRWMKERLRT